MGSPWKAAIWETKPERDEKIFDIQHKAILNIGRRVVT
jgi:hypothetical protein